MADPDRNAAIWFASDGYDPDAKGINGRRVAGASFLGGFFEHADVDEFVSVTAGINGRDRFRGLKDQHAPDTPHRALYQLTLGRIAPVGTMYYPAPNYAEHCWKRQACGMHRYSICGITHTTATQAVMRGFFDLRAGPQAEWDGVICTSHAVHAATLRNMEIAEDFLRDRFGTLPPRPQMPVIPLGIDCAAFRHDPEARTRLRRRMGWKKDDVVVVTLSRLLPYGKFDPGPLFVALQQAQETLGKSRRLHFLACGIYGDTHSKSVFESCAKGLMPDVSFRHLPGDDPRARQETLSGGDIFAFPIDNVQETFGLSPVEAMAAGLPVVVSDWDGMRDTVSEDAGIRIPTRTAAAKASAPEAEGYLAGLHSYAQYGNRLSMLTALEVGAMARAFAGLARNEDQRRRMGAAARQRAQTLYDWAVVIPQMQEFWAELAAIRRASAATRDGPAVNPVGPLPFDVFASYPSDRLDRQTLRVAANAPSARLQEVFSLRRYSNLGRPAEKLETLDRVLAALSDSGKRGNTVSGLSRRLRWNPDTVERAVVFLLKYDLARPV